MTENERPSQEEFAHALSEREIKRLEEVRQERGDEVWANTLGQLIITQLTLTRFRYKSGMESLAITGEETIKKLEPQLIELYTHPKFGNAVVRGMIEAFASRRYLSIDIEALLKLRRLPRR